jgi:hypothetical protein
MPRHLADCTREMRARQPTGVGRTVIVEAIIAAMRARTLALRTGSPACSHRSTRTARNTCRPARCSGARGTARPSDTGTRRPRAARVRRQRAGPRARVPPGTWAAAGGRAAARGIRVVAAVDTAGAQRRGNRAAAAAGRPGIAPVGRAAAAPRFCCRPRSSTWLPRLPWLHEAQSFALFVRLLQPTLMPPVGPGQIRSRFSMDERHVLTLPHMRRSARPSC